MRYAIFFLLLVTSFLRLKASDELLSRPKLIVTIVADQMRWDYLYRYYDRYTDKGFKRLMNDGFRCENAMINHLPAYTAPGHATIYTGSVPSVHGIAGNNWHDNQTGRAWYCVEDTAVQSVGGSREAGKMSPKNLLASTIADELKLATNRQSRTYGIALKDRGSILPAGHLANGAYWFDDSTGNLITSSYYADTLPSWLQDFNQKELPGKHLKKPWTLLYPPATYRQSLPDENPYEGALKGGTASFPHNADSGKSSKNYGLLRMIPAGNTYTFQAAKACIRGEKLGRKGNPDFLAISLSATDYIGHIFTPNSMEIEDTYLRLDKDLAAFLSFLDEYIGEGNYLLMLTADHGGAHNAAYLQDLGIPAGNESERTIAAELKKHLKDVFKQDSLIRTVDNYQVFFREDVIRKSGISRKELKDAVRNWLYQKPQVAYVLDMETSDQPVVPDLIRTMAANGHNRLRSGSLLIINNPGWYYGYLPTGTTHSTWHPYDTHLPLLWYGWGIRRGESFATIYMEDIAPTLAALLRIQMPNGCTGKVIEALFR